MAHSKEGPHWKVCAPRELEDKLINYMHLSSGHAGSDKCTSISIINGIFHLQNQERKTRNLKATCETLENEEPKLEVRCRQ
jgi:ribosomal protein S7